MVVVVVNCNLCTGQDPFSSEMPAQRIFADVHDADGGA